MPLVTDTPDQATSPPRRARRRRLSLLRRFRRREDGATAVEFAVLGAPFLILLFGIFEVALTFMAGRYLEDAMFRATRQVLTNQVQGQGDPRAAFTAALRAGLPVWLDSARVYCNIRPATNFGGTMNPNTDANGRVRPGIDFTTSTPGQIVYAGCWYDYPTFSSVILPMVNGGTTRGMGDVATGVQRLAAFTAFITEP